MTDQDHIDRIDALTRNARNTWFTLLAALVFVGITLMGVEHIDFYGVDRATKLPLIGVNVPTRYFFVAAPILITGIYGYFHLYLIRLWDALSIAPSRTKGTRFGETISPWLVTDAALHLRLWFRTDNCTPPRSMEMLATLLNGFIAWGFGLLVLYFLWTLSFAARTFWITGIAGVSFGLAGFMGYSSLSMMLDRMWKSHDGSASYLWSKAHQMVFGVGVICMIGVQGYQRTSGSIERLAGLNLYGENIIEKPAGWLSPDIARADFLAVWCKREDVKDCKKLGDHEAGFDKEWKVRRSAALADMRRPDWAKTGKPKPNFRDAELAFAFLSGADLSGAQMQRINLIEAQMEGASLSYAQMQGANLWRAQMDGASLIGAQLQGANLWRAQLLGANFNGAQMQDSLLSETQMQGANLTFAQMQGTDFSDAQMRGAALHFSQLTGTINHPSVFKGTDLSSVINNRGMLRLVDLRPAVFDAATDFRNTFLDGTVMMTQAFRDQMGNPCQWVKEPLDEAEFYARWRGWVDLGPEPGNWQFLLVPDAYKQITLIPPPPGCEWKTGPMPTSAPE